MTVESAPLVERDYRERLRTLQRNWLQALTYLLLTSALAIVLSIPQWRNNQQVDVQLGERASATIFAPQSKTYVSTVLTERARQQAADQVGEIYQPLDRQIGRNQTNSAADLYDFLAVVRADREATTSTKISYIRAIDNVAVDASVASQILELSGSDFEAVRQETLRVISEVMQNDLFDNVTLDSAELAQREVDLRLPTFQEQVVVAVAQAFIVPNRLFDAAATEAQRAAASDEVAPVEQFVVKGSEVVSEGQLVNDVDLELLEELGLLQSERRWWDFGRIAILSLLAVSAMAIFWSQHLQRRFKTQRYLFVFCLLFLLFALLAIIMLPLPDSLGLLFPAAALGMMLSVIITPRFAIMPSIILAMIVGFVTNESYEMTIYALAGTLAAVYLLRNASLLTRIFQAGVITSLVNIVTLILFNFTDFESWQALLPLLAYGFANGLIAASLTIAGFFVVGSLFGIMTTLQLQALARFDHPLLQELLRTAPGTYHHSIMVANLAEQAAQRIKADAGLVRVGAFYHDIGKMRRPAFFSENQEGNNPHDILDPLSSARIIIGHVTEGVELAQAHRLPRRIRTFIEEHHGDRLIGYFYDKAVEQAANPQEVDEADFRYPGPKPQTRETALVAMADSIEATSSAVRPNNPAACEKLVDTIIDELIQEGQLEDSDLTFNDIRLARETFITALQGRFHARVRYRGNEEIEAENTPVQLIEASDQEDIVGPLDEPVPASQS